MKRMTITIGRKRRYFTWRVICCVAVVTTLYLQGCNSPPLKLWHKVRLPAEFTANKADEIQTFDDYRQLEDRLFAQLEDKIYSKTETGPGYLLVRYSSGSTADPQHRSPNWNRSFELPTDAPVGGVLLLHGMSDSPYSLKALGETFSQRNYWVIAPRLPGHGTAPSGLKYIDWEDMAAVVRLSIKHLVSKVGQKPIHIVGYSTGAPLALDFALEALEGSVSPVPDSLVLISPAIGIHSMAGLAGFTNSISIIPGLGHLAWVSIQPEFDPYKYNSFATNAGAQVHRVTRSVAGRVAAWSRNGPLEEFPPTLVLKSAVDATVSTTAVVDNLLRRLGPHGHEFVLFDINRHAAGGLLLVSDPGPLTARLMADESLPFTVTFVTNENLESTRVVARRKAPFSIEASETVPLNLAWPSGVISLSHVALPFPPDDPLYGQRPPDDPDAMYLGQMAIKGERGLLKISYDWLFRLRHNPFYDYLESRALAWVDSANDK